MAVARAARDKGIGFGISMVFAEEIGAGRASTTVFVAPASPQTGTTPEALLQATDLDRDVQPGGGVSQGVAWQGRSEYAAGDAEERLEYVGQHNGSGERHGHGVLRWRNGTCFEGQWQHDKVTSTLKPRAHAAAAVREH